jgi:hypothetical protein
MVQQVPRHRRMLDTIWRIETDALRISNVRQLGEPLQRALLGTTNIVNCKYEYLKSLIGMAAQHDHM